jgi:S-adenosylmethionine:tRNA-ribosyltransferase-isomerase (queuine synthetase)
LNDTRVIPARLHGYKGTGGKVEIFLVRRLTGEAELWEALLRSSKPLQPGAVISLPENVHATVVSSGREETGIVSFSGVDDFYEWLDHNGAVPLPPYIKRAPLEKDRDRYQTVFARERGAVAAPTAGLHFTEALLDSIRGNGPEAGDGETDIFIYPGYEFKVVNALITNFHLPESTLLMLVSAFAGRERVLEAYRRAVESGFRFFSYGDAMFIS